MKRKVVEVFGSPPALVMPEVLKVPVKESASRKAHSGNPKEYNLYYHWLYLYSHH